METVIKPLGDAAIMIQLGEGISPAVHLRIKSLTALLNEAPFAGLLECVPAYQNLTVYYNPAVVHQNMMQDSALSPFHKVSAYIRELTQHINEDSPTEENTVTIPVLYGGEHGPDLAYVAKYHNLTEEEVIRIHSGNDYLVYMLGFAPGFPFIGGMSEQIATPRKEKPRLAIAPGSVGIAGKQTGVYPLETPGGWQIIGRTPTALFLPEQSPPTLLKPGDKIRFTPVSPETYVRYKEETK